jgi:predicted TIM-barrel fold metal-dependent hydrolase
VAVPAGACDCHAHVFAPEGLYAYAEHRPYTPADNTGLAAYRAMLEGIGIGRAVLVHSNIYGPDNRATTDALALMGDAFRGIALIRPDIDDAGLAALAAAGMRGIRINLEFPGEMTLDDVEAMAPRLARLGWHLQMLVGAARLPAIASRLLALPFDLVVDHMGLPSAEGGPASVQPLLPLLETGKVWIKLSAPYYVTSQPRLGTAQPATEGPPDHGIATAIAQSLFDARPDRMLWGSNWPHPHSAPVPDEGDLVDWLAEVVADEAGLDQVLVRNPAHLYGFDAS